MKGIAIQTILLMLSGILVAGILIYLVYTYSTGTTLSSYDCKAQLTSWCTSCSVIGWKGGPTLSKSVSDCTSKYLGYTTVSGIECDDQIGSTTLKCTSATNCPNATICSVVGAGSYT